MKQEQSTSLESSRSDEFVAFGFPDFPKTRRDGPRRSNGCYWGPDNENAVFPINREKRRIIYSGTTTRYTSGCHPYSIFRAASLRWHYPGQVVRVTRQRVAWTLSKPPLATSNNVSGRFECVNHTASPERPSLRYRKKLQKCSSDPTELYIFVMYDAMAKESIILTFCFN